MPDIPSPEKKRKRLRKAGDVERKKTKKENRKPAAGGGIMAFFAPKSGGGAKNCKDKGQARIGSFFGGSKDKQKEAEKKSEENKDDEENKAKMVDDADNDNEGDDSAKSTQKGQEADDKASSSSSSSSSSAAESAGDDKPATMDKLSAVKSKPEVAAAAAAPASAPATEAKKPDKPKKKSAMMALEASDDDDDDDDDDDEDDDDDDEGQVGQAGKVGFDPITSSSWKQGAPVPYSAIANLFSMLEDTPKRLLKTAYCADFFRAVIAKSPDQLLPAVYMCCNKIRPAYEGSEMGIGDALMLKALSEATGKSPGALKALLTEEGDIGVVAEESRGTQRTMFPLPRLTVPGVFKELRAIANTSGQNSNKRKADKIKRLLVSCKDNEARFVARGLQGNLRIGLAEKTVIAALSRAITLTPPVLKAELPPPVLDVRKTMKKAAVTKLLERNEAILKQAYIEVPNHELVVGALLKHGVEEVPNHCYLRPGIPVQAMLGKPAKGIQEILNRFVDAMFTIEFKYDGERAQIHLLEDGTINIYSRNSEDNTGKYPDLIARLPKVYAAEGGNKVTSFIIDCEVVAWDSEKKRILPFQTLSTRGRTNVKESDISVQVCLFAFDCIFINGESLINKPFQVRRKALYDNFAKVEGEFHFAESKDTKDLEDIQAFLDLAINSSCEGLMVKALDTDAHYVPNKRNWLKVKKDYLDGVGDTLDLVPIAAWHGKGKRTGSYGAYLLACYDEETEGYQSICKIGTGFKDDDLTSLHEALSKVTVGGPPRHYSWPSTMKPDVWFSTHQVWEVLCADLSVSPVHKAAIGHVHDSKGIALRFPRFLRLRPDKKPGNATSAAQVVDMYKNQSVIHED